MNPIPQVHPVCNSKELPELSWESAGMPPDFHTTLTTTSTAGTTRGATEEELEALTAYNWSRGQSDHRLACLRLKKQNNNKNKNHPNTQRCKQPYGSTSDDQYCKSWTVGKIQTPFSLPGRGPARWVTFPGGRGACPSDRCPLPLTSFLLHQLASSLREAIEEKWQTVRQSYNVGKKMYLAFFLFSLLK